MNEGELLFNELSCEASAGAIDAAAGDEDSCKTRIRKIKELILSLEAIYPDTE